MATTEECCSPVAYVYGGVTLSPKAPGQFSLGIRVDVGVITASVTGPASGDDHLLWHYLAVVKPGPARIRCTIGDVTSAKEIDAKPNQVTIANFCFGEPVITTPAKNFVKRKQREKERERVVVKPSPPPGGEGPRPVP
jgi:hypothetical protein